MDLEKFDIIQVSKEKEIDENVQSRALVGNW